MKKFITLASAMLLVPGLALAQGPSLGNLDSLITAIYQLVSAVVPILLVIAIIVFFWGLIKFIFNAGDEDGRKSGIQIMIWGVVALFVIVSVWGLVAFIQDALGLSGGATTIQGPNSSDLTGLVPGG